MRDLPPAAGTSPMVASLIVFGTIAVALVLLFNHLRTRRNQIDDAEAAVDAALQKRHDLVPNLNRTVRAHAAHERQLLAALAEARSELLRDVARGTGLDGVRLEHEGELARVVDGALLLAESYPGLRADRGFVALQLELAATEEEIAAARRFVAAAIVDYNNAVATVPGIFLAGAMGLRPRPQPRIPALQRVAPEVHPVHAAGGVEPGTVP